MDILKASILKAEENGPLSTQNEVWQKAAEIYNSTAGIPESITFSVVFLRAKQFDIEIKTTSARGKKSLTPRSTEDARPFPPEKSTKSKQTSQEYIDALRKNTPTRFVSLVERVIKGSKVAAIKLNCIVCCGGDVPGIAGEIRGCTSSCCPMYMFRPYQDKKELIPESV